MAESLSTLEGEDLDLDKSEAEFAAAMAAPPADKPGMAAPARKPPEPASDPERAPHGWTWKGGEWQPKQAPGRPRGAAEKPRVTDAGATPPKTAKAAPKASAPARDYRKIVAETVEGLWFLLASVPIPDVALGRKLTGVRTRVRVQASLLADNVDALAGGLGTIAAHTPFVARALDRLEKGDAGLWVLPAVMMVAPFAAATAQLWTNQLGDEAALEEAAAATEAAALAYVQAQVQGATAA